ncbi:hypothetical protein [Clostridium sp. AWRP]|uniref:hypothetical protein n=1 Tax=Clostridium sp. AWRP TaxID=2212991 RepID=UPI000FD9EA99|nr:hypothetical protein [Clostridium sp. AWRP]AZV55677.1 hypothetical protein DMR38_03215 [Clostridium sp. AWRP]
MPLWLQVLLQVAFIAIIFLFVYNQLKIRILYKFHPNRWIILLLSIAAFFLPTIIAAYFRYNLNGSVWQYISSAVFLVLFLWFVDLRSGAIYNVKGSQKENNIKIKPKAKPNRAKHNKNKK